MSDSVIFTKEQISTFVNAESVKEFAKLLISNNASLNDSNELVVDLPIPRAIYKSKLHNNYEEFVDQFSKKIGEILLKHNLEAELESQSDSFGGMKE